MGCSGAQPGGGRTPLTDVLGLPGHHAPAQPHHLDGVHVDLDDVVDEGQQRGQGKGCHKDGGEAVLDHCGGETPGAAVKPLQRVCPPLPGFVLLCGLGQRGLQGWKGETATS